MVREIGSFYEDIREKLNIQNISDGCDADIKLDANSYVGRRINEFISQGFKDYALLSCGREGFMMALDNIKTRLNNNGAQLKCVLPMYTCDTVVFPFEEHNCELHYYPVGKNFRPDSNKFIKLIEEVKPDVIVIHTYYGIDTVFEIREYLQEYRSNGGIVIEDLTQSLFMKTNMDADYYVISLRKWVEIPDGGLIISAEQLEHKPKEIRNNFVDAKLKAFTDKAAYLENVTDDNYEELQEFKNAFLSLNNKAEEMLDLDLTPKKMSEEAVNIINTRDFKKIEDRRKENALILDNKLRKLVNEYEGVMQLPLKYSGSEAPIYYPVFVKDREHFQKFMRENNIYVPVLWGEYENIAITDKKTDYIYKHILALPCDHRYTQADMTRITEVTERYLKL